MPLFIISDYDAWNTVVSRWSKISHDNARLLQFEEIQSVLLIVVKLSKDDGRQHENVALKHYSLDTNYKISSYVSSIATGFRISDAKLSIFYKIFCK